MFIVSHWFYIPDLRVTQVAQVKQVSVNWHSLMKIWDHLVGHLTLSFPTVQVLSYQPDCLRYHWKNFYSITKGSGLSKARWVGITGSIKTGRRKNSCYTFMNLDYQQQNVHLVHGISFWKCMFFLVSSYLVLTPVLYRNCESQVGFPLRRQVSSLSAAEHGGRAPALSVHS